MSRLNLVRTLGGGALCLMTLTACGESDSIPVADTSATAPRDTATLSADALAIAGFTTDTVRSMPWRNAVTAPARLMLNPESMETIGSITEGRVTHVLVRVGDRVRAGDVLVMIHSHEIMDARSALSQALSHVSSTDAEQKLAIIAAERAQRLLEAKAMSRADVERADAARIGAIARYEQAIAERDRAEALVEHLVGGGPAPANADPHDVLIRTPIGGVVIARDAQPGTVVLPGMQLVTVGNPDQLLLEMRLSEAAARMVRVGATVRYVLTDNPSTRYDAVVTRVAPTVDTVTRTVDVWASPRGGARGGRAESYAQAEILSADASTALVVPSAAVQALEGDTVVIVSEARGLGMHIEAVPVRIGRRTTEFVEILSGATAGRTVLVNGAAIAKAELLKRRTGGAGE